MTDDSHFIFWKYMEEYGIFDSEDGDFIDFRDDAPEEVKKSWEEYLKLEEKRMETMKRSGEWLK